MRIVNKVADRLLELVAPHTVARAGDCDYECSCPLSGDAKYCCYYPNGKVSCHSCQRYVYCA
jgi:hypothetical protein